MQDHFSCVPAVLKALEGTISPARLARFQGNASGDKHRALRTYIWNARLCEEFYVPIQLAEVSIRNAISNTLIRRFSDGWHSNPSFTSLLTEPHKKDLAKLVAGEKVARAAAFTADHVVSGMPMGFWSSLLTSRYENVLWLGGIRRSFPNAPKTIDREALHTRIERLRSFRNKVAHHFAIFDRGPLAEYQNILELVGFVCAETAWLVRHLSNPASVINSRPRV